MWCNALQIEQVIDNMLDNSLEAYEEKENLIKWGKLEQNGPSQCNINFEAWVSDKSVCLKVSDNGIGVKPEDLHKVFLPYFTTKATGRISRKGHGIGMYVIKKIMEAHQGRVNLNGSQYGQGVSFVLEFPLEIKENKQS